MRILLTVHRFLPEFSAGTEILTFDTARQLIARGHQVAVFTGIQDPAGLKDEQRFDRYTYEGIPVERFHYSRVPMGGSDNIMELEYNNPFLAAHFRRYLESFKPDVVHFFHLQKLSASPIDVCHELGIPMVMTPTDFWLVCPLSQLRLPDNSPCSGPDAEGVNCLRHVVVLSQTPMISALFSALPDRLLAAAMRRIRDGGLRRLRVASHVKALGARPEFLRKRMNLLDRVLVPSRLMEATLLRHGLEPGKVVFSRFGINFAHITNHPAPTTRAASRSATSEPCTSTRACTSCSRLCVPSRARRWRLPFTVMRMNTRATAPASRPWQRKMGGCDFAERFPIGASVKS